MVNQIIPKNPYTELRKHLGISQKVLARRSGVTEQVVTNTEAGLFHKPPVALSASLTTMMFQRDEYMPPLSELENLYRAWVRHTRFEHANQFDVVPVDFFKRKDRSWIAYREAIADQSFRGFCRALVFQPSMLREFEQRNLNKLAVRIALSECLVPGWMVDEVLESRGRMA